MSISREEMEQYCLGKVDESRAEEIELALESDPEALELFEEVDQAVWLDTLIDPDLLPDESAPDVDVQRAWIAEQMRQSREAKWWSIQAGSSDPLGLLEVGQATEVTVRYLHLEVDPDEGYRNWYDRSFPLTVTRTKRHTYQLTTGRWPPGYQLRCLRLGSLEVPELPPFTLDTQPVDPVSRAGSTREQQPAEIVETLLADDNNTGDDDAPPTSGIAGDYTATWDGHSLVVRYDGEKSVPFGTATLERTPGSYKQRQQRLFTFRNKRAETAFDLPSKTTEPLRFTIRGLRPDELYLLEHANFKAHLDDLVAEQPVISARATQIPEGYEVELWSEQLEFVGASKACWALQAVAEDGS